MNIAITTFNREDFLYRSIESLRKTDFPEGTKLFLFDDDSNPAVKTYLQTALSNIPNLTPFLHFNEVRVGCDKNMINSIRYAFANTDEDFVITTDSDAIYNKTWLKKLIALTKQPYPFEVGCIGMFDTKTHPVTDSYNDELNEKADIGGFGIALNRKYFMREDLVIKFWDWSFSGICKKENAKLLCTKQSYIQHIGVIGEHCHPDGYDQADNFIGE